METVCIIRTYVNGSNCLKRCGHARNCRPIQGKVLKVVKCHGDDVYLKVSSQVPIFENMLSRYKLNGAYQIYIENQVVTQEKVYMIHGLSVLNTKNGTSYQK